MNTKKTNGLSIHIGLNHLSEKHYKGAISPLESAVRDAQDLAEIAKLSGFIPNFLLNENAKRKEFTQLIKKVARQLKKNDILFLSFSGFGSFIPTYHNLDQNDFMVGWCLFDGLFLEAELLEILALFDEGVRIFIIQDSSYFGLQGTQPLISKQNTKTLPIEITWSTYLFHKDFYDNLQLKLDKSPEIKASVKYYMACQDNQVAYENRYNGLFTAFLKSNFNGGILKENYHQFFNKVLHQLPPNQSPSFRNLGIPLVWFDQQKPFQIS